MFRSPVRMHSAGADAESQSQEEPRPVGEIIDDMGFGWSQVKFACLGGGVWLADGAELLLISSVSQAASKEWGLTGMMRGFVVSVVFFGTLAGNVLSGPIGDNFGRRRCMLASYLGMFVFSVASSCSASYVFLCFFRFFVGLSMGVGQPAWTSMGSEITPSWTRAAMTSTSFAFFTCGEMYSAGLVMVDDPSMHNLHWRALLLLGSIPSLIFFILASVFLHESPVYLANAGQADDAKLVLQAMREENSAHIVPLKFSTSMSAPSTEERGEACLSVVRRQMSVVFGRRMLFTTLVVMYSCFVLNLAAFGCMYAFPQILPDIMQSGSAASELLIGAMWEFPGNALGCLFGSIMPRKRAIKLYLALSVVALVSFSIGAGSIHEHKTWLTEVLLYGGFYGIKCFVQIGFVIVYQYAVEVYPTNVRTTGLALNLAAGRLASTFSSMIYEWVILFSTFEAFFYGIAFLCVINALLIDFLRYETMGVQLKDSIEASSDSDRSLVAGSGDEYGATHNATRA